MLLCNMSAAGSVSHGTVYSHDALGPWSCPIPFRVAGVQPSGEILSGAMCVLTTVIILGVLAFCKSFILWLLKSFGSDYIAGLVPQGC